MNRKLKTTLIVTGATIVGVPIILSATALSFLAFISAADAAAESP